jgi:hypothetical protein
MISHPVMPLSGRPGNRGRVTSGLKANVDGQATSDGHWLLSVRGLPCSGA